MEIRNEQYDWQQGVLEQGLVLPTFALRDDSQSIFSGATVPGVPAGWGANLGAASNGGSTAEGSVFGRPAGVQGAPAEDPPVPNTNLTFDF